MQYFEPYIHAYFSLIFSQKQTFETGLITHDNLLFRIFNNYFKFIHKADVVIEEINRKITIDNFFRNCLALHIFLLIISVIIFVFEILIFTDHS